MSEITSNLKKLSGVWNWQIVFLASFFGCLYLVWPSRAYSYQGIRYAEIVESGDPARLAYPGHILYGFIGDWVYRLGQYLGYSGRAYFALQWLSTGCAIAGILLFYDLIRKLTGSARIAFLCALGMGATYGYWEYAANAEVYAPASFLLILTFWLVNEATSFSPRPWLWIGAGFVSSLAVLIHQMNSLLPLVVVVAVLLWPKTKAMRLQFLVTYAVTAVAFTILAYSLIWQFGAGKGAGISFVGWVFSYLRPEFAGATHMWSIDLGRIIAGIYGMWRALFGSFFVKEALLDGVGSFWTLLILLALAASAALVFMIAFSFKHLVKLWQNDRVPVSLSIGTIALFGSFVILWEGETLQYWFAVWISIWILVALGLSVASHESSVGARALPYVATGVVIALLATNFWGAMLPESNEKNDENFQYTSFAMSNIPSNSLIILPGWGGLSSGVLLSYFGNYNVDTFSSGLDVPASFNAEIQHALCTSPAVFVVTDEKRVNTTKTFGISPSLIQQSIASKGAWSVLGDKVQTYLNNYSYEMTFVASYSDTLNPNYSGNSVWRLSPKYSPTCVR